MKTVREHTMGKISFNSTSCLELFFLSFKYLKLLPILGVLYSLPSYAADPDSAFHLNEAFEKSYDFSIAVRAGDVLYIGGVTAVDDKGNEVHADDPRKQMALIYQRMGKILAAHGATFKNIVSETIYYNIDTDKYLSTLDIRSRHYQGVAGPSASGVRVAEFASENILIEIKAVAYLGD